MKKILTVFLLLGFVLILTGCNNNSEDIEALKKQNVLLQEQKNQLLQKQNELLTQKSEIAEEKALEEKTQAEEDAQFEKEMKCQERLDVLKEQYNNVHSIYYNNDTNTCYVRYYDPDNNNKLEESSIDSFGPIKTISVQQLKLSVPEVYGGVTHQQVVSVVNDMSNTQRRNTVIDLLLAGDVKGAQLSVGMTEGDNIAIESLADGYLGSNTIEYFKEPFKTIQTNNKTLTSSNITDKKKECAELESTIKSVHHVDNESRGTKLVQVFYSPKYDSCLYELYQDFFVTEEAGCGERGAWIFVKDYFSEETIIDQAGCRLNFQEAIVKPYPTYKGRYESYNEYKEAFDSYKVELQKLK